MVQHVSNAEVEIAILYIQAQVRTMRLGLRSRCRSKVRMDHPILASRTTHAAFIRNVCMVGDDSRTPYERRKGLLFLRQFSEIRECIWYPKPMFEGKIQ